MFYAHQCPETGRWFVCHEGIDNNLCECFDWDGTSAAEWAVIVSWLLNVARYPDNSSVAAPSIALPKALRD